MTQRKRLFFKGCLLLTALIMVLSVLSASANETYAKDNLSGSDSLSGWFSILWSDAQSSSGQTEPVYMLTDENGLTTLLQIDEGVSQLMGGALSFDRKFVRVQGELAVSAQSSSDQPIIDVSSITIDLAKTEASPDGEVTAALSGSKPWVSIMCKFGDVFAEPKNLSFFQGMYSSSSPGLDHYWREQSYNLVNIAGSDASGWFTLPQVRSYYVYDSNSDGKVELNFTRIRTDFTAAADPSVDFSGFTGINMMFNSNLDDYAWGGSSYMKLDGVSKTWSITYEPPWGYSDITVLAHEMGHGFGMPHSSGNYGETYDNVWDVMSDTWTNCSLSTDTTYGCRGQHTIAYHKDRLGWFAAGEKLTLSVGNFATVTLEQLALPQTSNIKMVKIPIRGSSTHFYTVEVRRKTGYDVKLPGAAVIIHDVDTTRSRPAYVVDADGNGKTGDAGAMWVAGEKFTDDINQISVQIDLATATGFTVTIRNGGGPTSLTPADGTALAQGKNSVSLKWKLPLYVSKKQVSSYRVQASTDNGFGSLMIDKYQSGTSLTWKGLLPDMSYYWRVQPIYKDGSIGSWSSSSFHSVMTKAPKLGSPGNNNKQKKALVKFTWSKPTGTPSSGYYYTLQYGTDNTFTDGLQTTTVNNLLKTNYSTLSIPTGTLTNTIFWRVKLTNSDWTKDYSGYETPKYFLR